MTTQTSDILLVPRRDDLATIERRRSDSQRLRRLEESLKDLGHERMAARGLAQPAEAVLERIMDHLPAAPAVAVPSPVSAAGMQGIAATLVAAVAMAAVALAILLIGGGMWSWLLVPMPCMALLAPGALQAATPRTVLGVGTGCACGMLAALAGTVAPEEMAPVFAFLPLLGIGLAVLAPFLVAIEAACGLERSRPDDAVLAYRMIGIASCMMACAQLWRA